MLLHFISDQLITLDIYGSGGRENAEQHNTENGQIFF
jgi:hypothetical protein